MFFNPQNKNVCLQALLYQQRAVLMSERVLGIDHPNTITEYVSIYECINVPVIV